ncbi:hypothetical protein J7E88_04265 [Streptomyces sp. ISL-10]|uniref:hypothetical protein n=1 Tax=Streptomyces sp. ISL-10 TaxID=2819172 RepID=UPI001BE6C06E|nr:hypothetical protein [Streptomyces sp. ISL-10]MBT2364559.1 hypothetical protein [Streptomyces sp. ISL-10]
MRTEEDTAVTERILLVESRAGEGALAALGRAFPPRSANEQALFLSYNYADVPVGRRFDCCFRRADERDVVWVATTVVAVTQQFGVAWDVIHHGWKTLALLRFEPEIPALIRDLPEASTWFERPISLYISDSETWEVRTKAGGPLSAAP